MERGWEGFGSWGWGTADGWAGKGVGVVGVRVPVRGGRGRDGDGDGDGEKERGGEEEESTVLVKIFGTHMQAGYVGGSQASRKKQARQVADFVGRHRVDGRSGSRSGNSNGAIPTTPRSEKPPAHGNHPNDTDPDSVSNPSSLPPSTPTPAREVLVLAGDFNMGPTPSSVHYHDRADAQARCAAYEILKTGSGLAEVRVEREGEREEYEGDVCRFLVGGLDGDGMMREGECGGEGDGDRGEGGEGEGEEGEGCWMTYEDLKGPKGERLSDTKAVALRVRVRVRIKE